MKKLDIFKETPTKFHNRINETLDGLENTKVIRYSFKKYAIVCAAVLVFCPILCVGAGKLFQWYQTTSERFDTEKELEDKLTAEGAVLPGNDSDLENGIEVMALQSVKKNDGYYFLAGFKWPSNVKWNEGIVFEKSSIISQNETIDCVASFADAPDEKGMVYVEVNVNGNQIIQEGDDIRLVLENICQSDKSTITDVLVEARWEIVFSLPKSMEVIGYETAQKLLVNEHELAIDKIEVGNFGVKIYTLKEEAIHATYYSTMWLSEVLYKDGTIQKQIETPLNKLAVEDNDGSFYFNIPFENIVDRNKVSALVFTEGDSKFTMTLGNVMSDNSAEEQKMTTLEQISGNTDMDTFQVIYERQNNVILTDNTNVYLWDKKCDNAKVIMKLADYGYNKENDGEVIAQQGSGGKAILMKPYGDSEKVYLWKLGFADIIEGNTEILWPKE